MRRTRRSARLAQAVDARARSPILAYLLAIAVAFLWPLVAVAIYVAVALMWLVPDKRFEQLID